MTDSQKKRIEGLKLISEQGKNLFGIQFNDYIYMIADFIENNNDKIIIHDRKLEFRNDKN
jgi:hypothetical protein